MKNLFLIILFITTNVLAIGQINPNGISKNFGINPPLSSFGLAPPVGVTYNVRAQAFFDRTKELGIILTTSQKSWYNDSIFVPLSDSGLIGTTRAGDSLACLWTLVKFPNGSETVAKLNLLDTAYTLTNVNAVTFTDSGAAGNGTSSYLNSNFIPSADSTICRMNSTSFGVYCKTNSTELRAILGGYDGSKYTTMTFSHTTLYGSINGGFTINGEAHTSSSSSNLFVITRQRYGGILFFLNGVQKLDRNGNATSTLTKSIFLLCRNNNGTPSDFSARCISFAFIGSGLSSTKIRALSNILNNSLKGRAYNVY